MVAVQHPLESIQAKEIATTTEKEEEAGSELWQKEKNNEEKKRAEGERKIGKNEI